MPTYSPQLLRRARERADTRPSQQTVALAIGKALSTYVRYESGAIIPTARVLGAIASVLAVSVADLYDADDPADDVTRFSAELAAMVDKAPTFTADQRARLRILLRGAVEAPVGKTA